MSQTLGQLMTEALNTKINIAGDAKFVNDVYVGCNSDGTGGSKLVPLPTVPVSNGDYILKITVSNGSPVYSWVAVSSLSGVTF